MSSAIPKVLLVGDPQYSQFDLVAGVLAAEVCGRITLAAAESARMIDDVFDAVIVVLGGGWDDWYEHLTSLRAQNRRSLILAVVPEPGSDSIPRLLDHDIDDVLVGPLTWPQVAQKSKELLGLVVDSDLNDVRQRLIAEHGLSQFVGQSASLLRETAKIPEISMSDSPVLIAGETGTGKELCARAIHYLGRRGSGPFIALNCGGLPDHLVENEVFGHVKGAYTDAGSEQKGLVYEADGGTLFLDEVNTLSLAAQVKLLRFLDEHRYKPLGSSRYVDADVRVVSASNVELADAVEAGQFRKDLYYRINVLSIDLPPIRERAGDIDLLADHFLSHYARTYRRGPMYLTRTALAALRAHDWPGNVRELKATLEKAVVLSHANVIRAEALQLPVRTEHCAGQGLTFRQAKREAIRAFENRYLRQLLSTHHNNVSHAAREAGKDRRSLQRLIRKHGLTLR